MNFNLFLDKMNLSGNQIQVIKNFAEFEERPDYSEYNRYGNLMKSINEPKLRLKERKKIPNTELVNGNDVRLLEGFEAKRDLPVGFAVTPSWDSGNNHQIEPAGNAILRLLWNAWATRKGNDWIKQILKQILKQM